MEKKKVHQDVVIGFVCLLITLFIFWINRNLAADAAMMPRLLAALLAFLSLLMIAEGVRKTKEAAVRNEEPKKYLDWDVVKIPLITWVLIAGYVILFNLVGYFIATAIALVVLMRFMKRRNWAVIIAVIVVFLAIMYYAFVLKMHVPVNNLGMLGRLL